MVNGKIIVWDLFGGGQNSVYKTIQENGWGDKYDIYTFDVTEPSRNHHFKLDLSQDDIVDKFKEFPKPDIICASPLCQSFSSILSMKGGGTCFWKLNQDKTKLIFRSVEEFEELKSGFTKNLKSETQLFIAKLGKKCIDNTIDLILHYKPKYWYIENPKHSLMWKYITLNRPDLRNYHFNYASYGLYGYLTDKPTCFLSNIRLNLRWGRIEIPYFHEVDENGKEWLVLKKDTSIRLPKSKCKTRTYGINFITKFNKSSGGGIDNDFKIMYAKFANSRTTHLGMKNSNEQKFYQKDKMTTEQIGEAGPRSAIPHDLIKDIFKKFDMGKEVVVEEQLNLFEEENYE